MVITTVTIPVTATAWMDVGPATVAAIPASPAAIEPKVVSKPWTFTVVADIAADADPNASRPQGGQTDYD